MGSIKPFRSLVPELKVTFRGATATQVLFLTSHFRIGRSPECDVCVPSQYVGRVHAEVLFENGAWWIVDLNSTNGIYVAGKKVQRHALTSPVTVSLGVNGPRVSFEAKSISQTINMPESPQVGEDTVDRIAKHYFDDSGSEPAGEHTMRVRKAFAKVQKLQRMRHRKIVGALITAVLVIGAYAVYEHIQVQRQTRMAKDIFYSIKALDLDLANLQRLAATPEQQAAARQYQERRRELEKNYDRFLSSLHVYDRMTERQRVILRVARIFGECELDMPADFEAEIDRYIDRWRSSGRLANALRTARKNGLTETIPKAMLDNGLPPQFFYLALQESNFDPFAIGPATRYGIAKGMWQFMPQTATGYGLHTGPLVEVRQADPRDERHDPLKASHAAGKYLKDIYSTDAQASGFLVMASYNWGENRVIPLIRSMPLNPRERNFWQLVQRYRSQIPNETYDYVFSIVSAAAIGENPRLFGFDFDDPLPIT